MFSKTTKRQPIFNPAEVNLNETNNSTRIDSPVCIKHCESSTDRVLGAELDEKSIRRKMEEKSREKKMIDLKFPTQEQRRTGLEVRVGFANVDVDVCLHFRFKRAIGTNKCLPNSTILEMHVT